MPIALFEKTTSGATMEGKAKQQEVLSIECSIDSLESICTSTTDAGYRPKLQSFSIKLLDTVKTCLDWIPYE